VDSWHTTLSSKQCANGICLYSTCSHLGIFKMWMKGYPPRVEWKKHWNFPPQKDVKFSNYEKPTWACALTVTFQPIIYLFIYVLFHTNIHSWVDFMLMQVPMWVWTQYDDDANHTRFIKWGCLPSLDQSKDCTHSLM
jgi:hypothetical protein